MKIYFLNYTFLIGYLEEALKELGIDYKYNNHHDIEKIKLEILAFKPDIVYRSVMFNCKMGLEYNDLSKWCMENGIKVLFWNIEDPNHFNSFIEQAVVSSQVFTTASECVAKYIKAGCKDVGVSPLACSKKLHYYEDKPKIYDISLIANWYPCEARVEGIKWILTPLINAGFDVKIWGHKDKWLANGIPEKHLMGYISYSEVAKVYNQSKIVLGANEQLDSPTMTSMRPYEVLGCRAFHLSAWSMGMANMFQDGKHLVLSRDPKKTLELVRFYLANQEARDKIAEEGQKYVYEKHTYTHRLKEMLKIGN